MNAWTANLYVDLLVALSFTFLDVWSDWLHYLSPSLVALGSPSQGRLDCKSFTFLAALFIGVLYAFWGKQKILRTFQPQKLGGSSGFPGHAYNF